MFIRFLLNKVFTRGGNLKHVWSQLVITYVWVTLYVDTFVAIFWVSSSLAHHQKEGVVSHSVKMVFLNPMFYSFNFKYLVSVHLLRFPWLVNEGFPRQMSSNLWMLTTPIKGEGVLIEESQVKMLIIGT